MNRRPRANKSFVPGGVYDPVAKQLQKPPPPPQLSYEGPVSVPMQVQQQPQVQVEPQAPKQKTLESQTVSTPNVKNNEIAPENVADSDGDDSVFNKRGKSLFKKLFKSRKKASVRAKEKRIRQNRQMRKLICPKNALMALHEVKGITISEFIINVNPTGGFMALATVNNKQYEGKGNSKINAKNNVCEKALRDYVLEKMQQKPRFRKTSTCNQSEDLNEHMEIDEAKDGDEENGDNSTDDVPMINLASFAIYKLFAEWENEGYVVPEMHPNPENAPAENSENKEPKKPPVRNELPPNWESLHPTTLLCMMRPGLIYRDCGCTGETPNILHKVSITVDNREFTDTGRSKKLARRNVAIDVCNTLFGTTFAK